MDTWDDSTNHYLMHTQVVQHSIQRNASVVVTAAAVGIFGLIRYQEGVKVGGVASLFGCFLVTQFKRY